MLMVYAGQRLIDFEYVKYIEPNIKTTFIGENNYKELFAKNNIRLIDIIEYKDLPLGEVKIASDIIRKNKN